MNFLKRALLYIWRKKHRSIVLIMTVFAMASFVLTGLVLRSGAEREAAAVREALGSSFVLKIDNNDMSYYEPGDFAGSLVYAGPMVTSEMIDTIMEMEGVTDFFVNEVWYCWTSLKLRPGTFSYTVDTYDPDSDYSNTLEGYTVLMQDAPIVSCNDGNLHEFFRIGAYSIVEGRNIEEGDHNSTVISEYLAEKNGLSAGDSFTIEMKEGCIKDSSTPDKAIGEPITVRIVGVFSVNFEQELSIYTGETGYAENIIFSSQDVVGQIKSSLGENSVSTEFNQVTFFADSPEQIEIITEQIKTDMEKEIDGLLLEWDDTAYQATTDALNGMLLLANLLIFAGVAGCLIVLTLLVHMWVKTRKREIGILLSVGGRRGEILLQMVLECLIPAILAVVLAVLLSGRISEAFCNFAEKTAFADSGEIGYNIEQETGADLPAISQIGAERVYGDYTVAGNTAVLLLLAVGTVTVGSTVLAAWKIVRTEPRLLLQNH